MFHGKCKALTFSFDDGVTQDRRLVEIFNRWGLRATFNLNSELLGHSGSLWRENQWVSHDKVSPQEAAVLYANHEVAVHTLNHFNLTELDQDEVIRQVEEDRKNLELITGKQVLGMAYPCGGVNNNERTAEIIRDHTKVRYARTTTTSGSFRPQKSLFRYQPTVYHLEFKKMVELGKEFLRLRPDPLAPACFFVWGHSYELDYYDTWGKFEEFCRMMSGREDIFYGTNRDVLL